MLAWVRVLPGGSGPTALSRYCSHCAATTPTRALAAALITLAFAVPLAFAARSETVVAAPLPTSIQVRYDDDRLTLSASEQPLEAVAAALAAATPVRVTIQRPSLREAPLDSHIVERPFRAAITELLADFDWVATGNMGSDDAGPAGYRILVVGRRQPNSVFKPTESAAVVGYGLAVTKPLRGHRLSPSEALAALDEHRYATAEEAGRWAVRAAEADREAVLTLLDDWTRTSDPRAQRVAAVVLGQVGGDVAVATLEAVLLDPGADALARRISANSLAQIQNDGALRALEAAFTGGDAMEQQAVPNALLRSADDETLARAAPWLSDEASLTTSETHELIRKLAAISQLMSTATWRYA